MNNILFTNIHIVFFMTNNISFKLLFFFCRSFQLTLMSLVVSDWSLTKPINDKQSHIKIIGSQFFYTEGIIYLTNFHSHINRCLIFFLKKPAFIFPTTVFFILLKSFEIKSSLQTSIFMRIKFASSVLLNQCQNEAFRITISLHTCLTDFLRCLT